jgi:hypothetical protein
MYWRFINLRIIIELCGMIVVFWFVEFGHVSTTQQTHQCHVAATSAPLTTTSDNISLPCGSHISAMWQPCHHHVIATRSHVVAASAPRGCHISDTFLKHHRHVICHIIATSSATSSLQVMWQVNPWRSLSSHILGFGLGLLGFTPIYDGLKTSWITTIHDETVNTSWCSIHDEMKFRHRCCFMTKIGWSVMKIDRHRSQGFFSGHDGRKPMFTIFPRLHAPTVQPVVMTHEWWARAKGPNGPKLLQSLSSLVVQW